MAVICEDCQNRPVEIAMTDAQLQTASRLLSVAGPNGGRVWVQDAGYGLVAVRHYVESASGYRTTLVSPKGELIYARVVGFEGVPVREGVPG
jgi:hypothetical protein